jgi:hypothetical protein
MTGPINKTPKMSWSGPWPYFLMKIVGIYERGVLRPIYPASSKSDTFEYNIII